MQLIKRLFGWFYAAAINGEGFLLGYYAFSSIAVDKIRNNLAELLGPFPRQVIYFL